MNNIAKCNIPTTHVVIITKKNDVNLQCTTDENCKNILLSKETRVPFGNPQIDYCLLKKMFCIVYCSSAVINESL